MKKQEKKFIKFIGKKICEVLESYNYKFCDEFTDYGKECFKEERSKEVQYFIDWAEDRGVNPAIIEYWRSMDVALFYGEYIYGAYTV